MCRVDFLNGDGEIKSKKVKIPGSNVIRSLQENDGCTFLGVLQNDEVMEKEMRVIKK